MSSYQAYKKNVLKDPEIKAEYEALEPEFDIIQALFQQKININFIFSKSSKRKDLPFRFCSRSRVFFCSAGHRKINRNRIRANR